MHNIMPLVSARIAYTALFMLSAAWLLYGLSAAPTISWGDSADLAMRMVDTTDQTFINSSRDYQLYRLIGDIFQQLPLADVGHKANLMSGFFGGLVVGIITLLAGGITRSTMAALAAGIACMLAHSFWLLCAIAEVYSFSLFCISAAFLCAYSWAHTTYKRYMLLCAFFAGLYLSHHPSGLVLAAVLGLFVLSKWRQVHWPTLMIALLLWAVCAGLYWPLVQQRLAQGLSLLSSLGLLAGGNAFYDVSPAKELAKFILFAGYNFAGLTALLIPVGLYGCVKHKHANLLPIIAWILLFMAAGITSSIPDKFNIYVLIYPFMALLAGLGFHRLQQSFALSKRLGMMMLASLLLAPPSVYVGTVYASKHFGFDVIGARSAPYRDNAWYFLWPPKWGDIGARQYAQQALAAAKPNAIIIADYTLWRPMLFLQRVEAMRSDVKLVFVEPLLREGVADYIAKHEETAPIYLATNTPARYYQLEQIKPRYQLRQRGVIFEVSPLRPDTENESLNRPALSE